MHVKKILGFLLYVDLILSRVLIELLKLHLSYIIMYNSGTLFRHLIVS